MAERRRKRAGSGTSELDKARKRITELESDLGAAQRTIGALLDKAERRNATSSPHAEIFEAAARMEQLVDRRTREVEEKTEALSEANEELRALSTNLDQIVRQRTRALAESEAQLRRKNVELERLNEMKAEFISIAAHELRTPLTSIVGYLDLVMEGRFGALDPELERPMGSLRRNAHRLKRLVDEMLDVSRIEAGKVVLDRRDVALESIVRDVVAEVEPLANAKKQDLRIEVEQAIEVHADPDKVHQIASNLLANAIRYTPEGGEIRVIVDAAPQDRFAGSWARLRVRDNGPGIPQHLRSRIFEPFSAVHPARHHTSSGPDSAGLGLYIARELIDLHGGLITVESEEGEYSEFTVLLPRTEDASQTHQSDSSGAER